AVILPGGWTEFILKQIVKTRAQPRAQQSRPADLRATQRNHALSPQPSCSKQFADRDDFLIIEIPDGFARTDRRQKMNMRTRQTGWVRPGKIGHAQLRQIAG